MAKPPIMQTLNAAELRAMQGKRGSSGHGGIPQPLNAAEERAAAKKAEAAPPPPPAPVKAQESAPSSKPTRATVKSLWACIEELYERVEALESELYGEEEAPQEEPKK